MEKNPELIIGAALPVQNGTKLKKQATNLTKSFRIPNPSLYLSGNIKYVLNTNLYALKTSFCYAISKEPDRITAEKGGRYDI